MEKNIEESEIEVAAEKMLCEMMEENSPKLIQFMLSCIARNMKQANATDMYLSCDLNIEGKRYTISTKANLNLLTPQL